MTAKIAFSNPGTIDPALWETFGVSVKVEEDSIGQFGTGLKYAIAVILRHEREIYIESGGETYTFTARPELFRGKEFLQIYCNEKKMPFTTHLGAHWELWQAYREIYSNCLDEGGCIGPGGDTVVVAELGDIDHNEIFLDETRAVLAKTPGCEVYRGGSMFIYYKGIRAHDLPTESKYTYNLLDADLTEDRTLKHDYQIGSRIGGLVLSSDCHEFVEDFALFTKDKFEESISFDYSFGTPSEFLLGVIDKHRKNGVYIQPSLLSKALGALGSVVYDKKPPNEHQELVIGKASDFLDEIGYPMTFPIFIADNLGDNILALADVKAKQIYLSPRVLTMGSKQVASTLMEEQMHLAHGLSDLTYNMQSFLFDQIVTMGERLIGKVL